MSISGGISGEELLAKLGPLVQCDAVTAGYMAQHMEDTGECPEFTGISPAGHCGIYRGVDSIYDKQIASHMPAAMPLPSMARDFGACASGDSYKVALNAGIDLLPEGPKSG